MTDFSDDDRSLIESVGADVLVDVAPAEVSMYAATSEAYFAEPAAAFESERDNPVGFGLELVTVLTPYVLSAVTAVVKFLGDIATNAIRDSATEQGKSVVSAVLRRWFGKVEEAKIAEVTTPSLSQEEVRQARKVAFDQATTLGLAQDQANLLADAIAGRLVTA